MIYMTDMLLIPCVDGETDQKADLRKAMAGTGMVRCAQIHSMDPIDVYRAITDEEYSSKVMAEVRSIMDNEFYADADGISGGMSVELVNIQAASAASGELDSASLIDSLFDDAIHMSCNDRGGKWSFSVAERVEGDVVYPADDADSATANIDWIYDPSCVGEPDEDDEGPWVSPRDSRGYGPRNYPEF